MYNGSAAFPIERKIDSNGFEIQPYEYGMSLRDYFASKATDEDIHFFKLLAEKEVPIPPDITPKFKEDVNWERLAWEGTIICKARFLFADAMLKERDKKKEG